MPGRARTRSVRLTICRSLVPELEEKLCGRVRMSKMEGFWSQGMRKWVPSETTVGSTPWKRSKMTARCPPSTVYRDVETADAVTPTPAATLASFARNETAACPPPPAMADLVFGGGFGGCSGWGFWGISSP
jgi:hypothetical protein